LWSNRPRQFSHRCLSIAEKELVTLTEENKEKRKENGMVADLLKVLCSFFFWVVLSFEFFFHAVRLKFEPFFLSKWFLVGLPVSFIIVCGSG
jgi:hypothetical protein